jgi:hypothetical protein
MKDVFLRSYKEIKNTYLEIEFHQDYSGTIFEENTLFQNMKILTRIFSDLYSFSS